MITKTICSFEFHVYPNHDSRRGLAFLIFPANDSVNAKTEFDGMKDKDKRWFRSLFDHWLDGKHNPAYFHRWDRDEFDGKYTNIFVFKQRSRKHRIYGFLCNPNQQSQRYQQCVLVNYASKGEWATDERSLRLSEDVRRNSA